MYNHVLVPIAIDHGETTQQALKVARKLVTDGGKLTALNVLEAIPGYVLAELPEGQMERNREAALAALKEEAGDDIEYAVVIGHAGRTILDFAEVQSVDCIVIASHQPGLQDYFLGSTASRVVRHAHCAVHVVR